MLDLSDSAVAAAAQPQLLPAGEHLLWTGPMNGDTPWIKIGASYRSVRRAWWRAHGGALGAQERLRNRCGDPRCVAIAHQQGGWTADMLAMPVAEWSDATVLARAAGRLVRADGHWRWTGQVHKMRPLLRIYRRALPVEFNLRRVAWRAAGRPLDRPDQLLNTCGDVRCIEPAHQERVRRRERVLRQVRLAWSRATPARPPKRVEPVVTWTELRRQDPFACAPRWPDDPPAVQRACARCNQLTWTRPGYVPFCSGCDEQQYAPRGAMARRGLDWGG